RHIVRRTRRLLWRRAPGYLLGDRGPAPLRKLTVGTANRTGPKTLASLRVDVAGSGRPTKEVEAEPEIPQGSDDEAGEARGREDEQAGGVEDHQPGQERQDQERTEGEAGVAQTERERASPRDDDPGEDENGQAGDAEGQDPPRVDLAGKVRADRGGRWMEDVGELEAAVDGRPHRPGEPEQEAPQREARVRLTETTVECDEHGRA